ncbi:MAG: hypothetical protein N2515_10995, partial [Deltaproteobacteria bacterium]|nr:hypothetical protein [Deltaproteobacteria bacterium]
MGLKMTLSDSILLRNPNPMQVFPPKKPWLWSFLFWCTWPWLHAKPLLAETPSEDPSPLTLLLELGGNASRQESEALLEMLEGLLRKQGLSLFDRRALWARFPPSRLRPDRLEDALALAHELGAVRLICVSPWFRDGRLVELALSLHTLTQGTEGQRRMATVTISPDGSPEAEISLTIQKLLNEEERLWLLDPSQLPRSPALPTPQSSSPPPTLSPSPSPQPNPLERFVSHAFAPVLLVALGASALGLGTWASLDSTCELYNLSL